MRILTLHGQRVLYLQHGLYWNRPAVAYRRLVSPVRNGIKARLCQIWIWVGYYHADFRNTVQTDLHVYCHRSLKVAFPSAECVFWILLLHGSRWHGIHAARLLKGSRGWSEGIRSKLSWRQQLADVQFGYGSAVLDEAEQSGKNLTADRLEVAIFIGRAPYQRAGAVIDTHFGFALKLVFNFHARLFYSVILSRTRVLHCVPCA